MTVSKRIERIDAGIATLIRDNDDVKALVSIGSYSQGTMDKFSDIDLYLFTTNPSKYQHSLNYDWLNPLGKVLSRIAFIDGNAGVGKNKVVFSDGLMYDITIIRVSRLRIFRTYFFLTKSKVIRLLPAFLRNGLEVNMLHFYNTIKRGYRIHKDEIGLESVLTNIISAFSKVKQDQITEAKFVQTNQAFWQCCYDASVKLIRKDFYYKFLVFDKAIRKNLITLLEWRAKSEGNEEVYYEGRKVEQWAGKEIADELYQTLKYENEVEMLDSLLITIRLFVKESHYLSSRYGYPLNTDFEEFVIEFIENVAIPQCERHQQELTT
ncbi:MAG: aminoglycoside 6-adenylyltransferase [Cyclobacteriaceae bacterium]